MVVAGAAGPARDHVSGEERWWLASPLLEWAIAQDDSLPSSAAFYQFGDAVLAIASDDPALLELFAQLYGDCAVAPPTVPDQALIHCSVRRGLHPWLLLLTFHAGTPPDPAALALPTLHPPPGTPRYTVLDSPVAGWRLVGHAAQPVLAVRGCHVLIDHREVPPHFVLEYLVSAMLAAQPDLLALHAASVRVGDAGVLIAGATHAGKTTTSAHLAARGHTLLGDELAIVRLAACQILPLRRTMNLRPGPPVGERWVKPVRIGRLFPDAPPQRVTLRSVFYLNGFAERASIQPLALTLHDEIVFEALSGGESLASWGLLPQRRALRLLAFWRLLTRVPCWRLDVGAPDQTAELIERTMEGLEC